MVTMGELSGLRKYKKGHDGKISYRSIGLAQAALRSLFRRHERETGGALDSTLKLNVYACYEDGAKHYHIGRNRFI